MRTAINAYLGRTTSAAPLLTLRVGFGVMMLLSVVRFWAYGWIDKLYLSPSFYFSYRYFEWVKPVGDWTYLIFVLVGLSAAGIALGYRYRFSLLIFFLSFTYVELMDKTTYLNHYYFISLLSLLLLLLPWDGRGRGSKVAQWQIDAIKLFVGVVYFYAGLAKLNSDWLLAAQPLAIWLPASYDVPLLGDWLQQRWVHFAFAWAGAAYDLLIPFLLLWRPTRGPALFLVVVFHVLTRVLFPIGMFPYIMIVSALIFFDPETHARIQRRLGLKTLKGDRIPERLWGFVSGRLAGLRVIAVALLLVFHLLFPFRYLLSPGELFWTESGYRFSWRVMLMEKAGLATFRIEDVHGRRTIVDNREFLTAFQEKQMSTQPDFILEYAHFLAEVFEERGFERPKVYVDSYVALNGRLSQRYVDPEIDLTEIDYNDPRTQWLLPFEDIIYGL